MTVKISALTGGSALDGTEAFEAVQAAASVKLTAAQIKTYTQIGMVTSGALATALGDYALTASLGDLALLDAASIAQVTGLQDALDAKASVASLADYYTASQVDTLLADYDTSLEVAALLATNATNDRARANHTGSQIAATISDFSTAVDARIGAASVDALSDVAITAAASGDYLRHDGTAWVDSPIQSGDVTTALTFTPFANPMTTAADLIVGGASGVAARLAKGTALQVLRMNSGATAVEWADPAGGLSGLTTNTIPVATGAAAIGNSKLVMSGTNLGTATLYDSTASTGSTLLVVKGGAAQTSFSNLLDFQYSDGTSLGRFQLVSATAARMLMVKGSSGAATFGIADDATYTTFRWYIEGAGAKMRFPSDGVIAFDSTTTASAGSLDIDLRRGGTGMWAIGDGGGAGGQGGIGVTDTATNAISAALYLRHNTSGTPAAGFGTGLRYQGETTTTENVDMARTAAVWTTATHASRTSKWSLDLVASAAALATRLEVDHGSGADSMGLLLWDLTRGAMVRVERGAADSGGSGYRALRVVN